MLKLVNINAHYGKVQILWDISLEMEAGEIVCLIGANGAGKSTLLKVLCGYVPATSGDIFYMDERINSINVYVFFFHLQEFYWERISGGAYMFFC